MIRYCRPQFLCSVLCTWLAPLLCTWPPTGISRLEALGALSFVIIIKPIKLTSDLKSLCQTSCAGTITNSLLFLLASLLPSPYYLGQRGFWILKWFLFVYYLFAVYCIICVYSNPFCSTRLKVPCFILSRLGIQKTRSVLFSSPIMSET